MAIPGDNPIRRSDEDVLGRSEVANRFATQVLSLDVSEGAVVGVLGPWGHGKTSFVNLARETLTAADIPVLDFNPWMFSGTEQLVESFFTELAAQLRPKPGFAEIAADLASYGDAFSGLGWVPVAGPWVERIRGGAKALSKLLESRRQGVHGRREALTRELARLTKPLVVVLDDIDRLTTQEIRDIFRLVRLTASFPNIIYLLAFDRQRVETALAEQGVPGRAYLEKILQVTIELPPLAESDLTKRLLAAMDEALGLPGDVGPFDSELWPDVLMEVVHPLVRSMRHVRRYVMGIKGTVDALDGQIELVDVLGLEAIRIFLPEVFALLHGSVHALTATSNIGLGQTTSEDDQGTIQSLLDAAGDESATVRSMIRRLFPAAGRYLGGSHYGSTWARTWLRKRRVAHETILRLYLERVPGEEFLSFIHAERAWKHMQDKAEFEAYLHGLNPDQRQDVVAALGTFEGEFTTAQVVPGVTVLLNLIPELPERPGGMFQLEPRFTVGRIVFRLLSSLENTTDVEAVVRDILPDLTSLSSKFELVTDVGYRENAGHELVSDEAADRFEDGWLREVQSATVEQLLAEWDLYRVLLFARLEAAKRSSEFQVPNDPRLTYALLRSAASEVKSGTVGDRAVRRKLILGWENLAEIFGDETTLLERITSLNNSDVERDSDLMDLVERYVAGWRPPAFGS